VSACCLGRVAAAATLLLAVCAVLLPSVVSANAGAAGAVQPTVLAQPGPSESMAARFENHSRPTRCAEEDNVDVRVVASQATRFTVMAEHPPYGSLIQTDSTAPDFTHCDMSGDPVFKFEPRTVVLYEDATIRLVGHRFETFWRPEVVDFVVGGRSEPGLHLVQLLRKGVAVPTGSSNTSPTRDIEILVVYPSDGYWRAKPLPPEHLPDTAYGSSFLVGPVEEDGRPIVRFRAIRFDPASLGFHLDFALGGSAILTVAEDSRIRTRLAITLDRPVPSGRALAALRSMYVTADNADASAAVWPLAGGEGEILMPIMRFQRFDAAWGRFGRVLPSRHNLSAPDTVLGDFGGHMNREFGR
jgi:hypothetical protein